MYLMPKICSQFCKIKGGGGGRVGQRPSSQMCNKHYFGRGLRPKAQKRIIFHSDLFHKYIIFNHTPHYILAVMAAGSDVPLDVLTNCIRSTNFLVSTQRL